MPDLFRERKWDLVGRRGIWFALMIISIVLSIAVLVFRSQKNGTALNWGIDFTGGGLVNVRISPDVALGEDLEKTEQIRTALEKTGLRVGVQLSSTTIGLPRDQVVVRTQLPRGVDEDAALEQQTETIESTLQSVGYKTEILGNERVSAVVSKELIKRATMAVIFGCLGIIIWIFIRYDFGQSLIPKYGLCAIFALLHDLILLAGTIALVWWVVDSAFVAAFLTVLGYSVHDTIVIFDRIRENVKLRKRPTFAETVNISLLETMVRSVNTGLTVLFVLISVYAFGGATLRSFAGALLIGTIAGTWSSIFIASQLLVSWKKREEKGKLAASSARASAKSAPTVRKPPAPPKQAAPQVSSSAAPSADERTESPEPTSAQRQGAASSKKLRGKKRHHRF